jgi:hypothetical protein
MVWQAVGAIGGAAVGAAGNAMAARRQNRAVEAQNNFMNTQFAGYPSQSAMLALGPDAYRYLAGQLPGSTLGTAFALNDEERSALEREAADLQAQIGAMGRNRQDGRAGWSATAGRTGPVKADPAYANLTTRLAQVKAQLADNSQKIDRSAYNALASSGISPVSQMEGFAKDYVDQNQAVSDRFEADASGTRKILDTYGQSERDRIERDSARALAGTQRVTRSNLARGGMGLSSLAGSAYTANANRAGEFKNNALGSLADRTAELRTNLNTSQGAQRTSLGLSNASAAYQANSGVAGTKLNLLTGQEWMPWSNRAAPGMPSASPGGAAMQTFGNSLSAMGGLYGMANYGRGSSGGGGAFQYDTSSRPDIWQPTGGSNWDAA